MPELTKLVFDLGMKLKYFDPCLRQFPVGGISKDILPDWLEKLKILMNDFNDKEWSPPSAAGKMGFQSFCFLTREQC
jgi:hypothetical protein